MSYSDSYNKAINLVFEYNKTSLFFIFQEELSFTVAEERTSLGSDDNAQCSFGENVDLNNEGKQTNEQYLGNREDMSLENLVHNERASELGNDFCTASGDVDNYHYAFNSDILDDRDDNGDQSTIHIGNIVKSIVSTDDDVSLSSLTVCIFGISKIIIIITLSNIADIFRNLR